MKKYRTSKYMEEGFWLKPENQYWNNDLYTEEGKQYLNDFAESTRSKKANLIK
jgi:hypothetical protein